MNAKYRRHVSRPTHLLWRATLLLSLLLGCSNNPATTNKAGSPDDRAGDSSQVGARYSVIIRGGTIYDGSGRAPFVGDVAIDNDRIAVVGTLDDSAQLAKDGLAIDATGMAVAPGFINMLSWAGVSLIEDGRGLSDIRQGVTLEVMGEGTSSGPLNDEMKRYQLARQGDIRFDIEWTTLGQYLEYLEKRGVAPNVASFVGATTVRIHVLGREDRAPSPDELKQMQALVRVAMLEGALGVGSSLIYAPAFFASTDELVALCQVAAEYDGMYITHMRSEANRLLEAVDEVIEIARRSGIKAEIYHLKAAGKGNWDKLDPVIAKIQAARASGLRITADMYTYTAGYTGLNATMPPWVKEGGHEAWVKRLRDPAIRQRVKREMTTPSDEWENFYLLAGSPDSIILSGFDNPKLKPLVGKTLAEVARQRGTSPEDTIMDLVVEDDSRVGTVYFLMSEDNVEKQIALPWMSFGSDADAPATEGVFLTSGRHPRAYGNFARLLGRYVRERKVISLAEAIRRLTSLPASNLGLRNRGRLAPGHFADVVVFSPETVADRATFNEPHQYATGVQHVLVNGVRALANGEPTGAKPGRFVRGPGWRGAQK